MSYKVQFDYQPIVETKSWEEAQVTAAKKLIEAFKELKELDDPVKAVLTLGFRVRVGSV